MLDERDLAVQSSRISVSLWKAWDTKKFTGVQGDTSFLTIQYCYDKDKHLISKRIYEGARLLEIISDKYDNGNLQLSFDSVCANPDFMYSGSFPSNFRPDAIYPRSIKTYYVHDTNHIQTYGANNQGIWYLGVNSINPLISSVSASHVEYPHIKTPAGTIRTDTIVHYNSQGIKTGTSVTTTYNSGTSVSPDSVRQYITNRYDNLGKIIIRFSYRQFKHNAPVLQDSVAVEYY